MQPFLQAGSNILNTGLALSIFGYHLGLSNSVNSVLRTEY